MFVSWILAPLLALGLLPNTLAVTIRSIHRRQNATTAFFSDPSIDPSSVTLDGDSDDASATALLQQVNDDITAAISSSPGRQLLTDLNQDITTSGNYALYKCGAGKPGSHAAQLSALLLQIWSNLQGVISELKTNGMNSQYGASAFFKSSSNLVKVQNLYQSIADGQLISVPSIGPQSPIILCADSGTNTGWFEFCEAHPGMAGWQKTGNNALILCPPFWSLINDAPTQAFCPTTSGGVVSPSDATLQFSKQGALIHEMSHLYLVENAFQPEKYNINDNIALSAADSVNSPSNYAFFYSGKLKGMAIREFMCGDADFFAAFVAKCTSWPLKTPSNPFFNSARFGGTVGNNWHGGDEGL